jgi:hypothetical protein
MSGSIIEQYIKEMEKDVVFDDFTIKDTQMKLPAIKHKWIGRLIRHKGEIHKLEQEFDVIKAALIAEAREKSSYNVSAPVLEKAVLRHKLLVDKKNEVRETKLIVELLEKTEKLFSGMSFDLKNLVEIIKMETL